MALNVTLDDVQGKVAAIIDQNEDTSDISSADYSLRRAYINMSQRGWAETYDWKSLYRENNSRISTSTGNASVALPADFRKLASRPVITSDGTTTFAFEEIRPQERFQFDASKKFVTILGDQNVGFTMFVNAPTLASGASVFTPYYASPASLVSPANVVMCPNPEYLVQRTLAYVWESYSDPRFPQAKSEADKILQNMLSYEQVYGEGYNDSVKTQEQKYHNFRWGRN